MRVGPIAGAVALLLAGAACTAETPAPDTAKTQATTDADGAVVLYCGRSLAQVGPLVERFTAATGVEVEVRDGKTGALTALLMEEGHASPADVFWAQDAGALGALSAQGRLAPLDQSVLDRVPAAFRSAKGDWVGLSGRARVVTYNTDKLKPADLPKSILEFTDPKWKGRIGWPPKNASFQAFVTSLRLQLGDDGARKWLDGIVANEPKEYPKNTPAAAAVANGEIDVAFVNHYYLFRLLAEKGEATPARNYVMPAKDAGNLINVAGAAVLSTSERPRGAAQLIEFLLSDESQTFFTQETYEYPMVAGVAIHELLTPLADIGHPDVDLNGLADLKATVKMLRDAEILE